MLYQYLQTLQGFLRDRSQRNLNVDDLRHYINRARREIALRTQSIRELTPISGSVQTLQILAAGSGYTNPTITITPPDFPNGALPNPGGRQAIASVEQAGGSLIVASVSDGGDGYFQPQVTISDPHGTGAFIAASTNRINATGLQQEIYNFSDVDLSRFPGVGSVFAVKSISIIYANYRYSLPCYDFSTYQAKIRNYPTQYQYVPTVCGQYGQGTNGSLYMYPLPSQIFQMEWDCFCLPIDLVDDADFEAIPMPWSDAVPIGAAVYAYEELQNWNASKYWYDKFEAYCHKYSAWARPGRVTNPYGRY